MSGRREAKAGINKQQPTLTPHYYSCNTIDIRVDLQSLTTITSSLADGQDRLHDNLLTTLAFVPTVASKMISQTVEGVLQKYAEQIQTKTTEL